MQSPLIFTLLGRAGCGKGTQAKLLTEKFGLTYIGSGEMLRSLAKNSDFAGENIKRFMQEGKLVPSSLIIRLWINRLEEIKAKQDKDFSGIIFDGIPRMLIEAKVLADALSWYEWDKNFKAILVDISREEAFGRLTKRRQCKNCGQLIPYVGDYKNLEKCDKCGGELVVRQDDTPEAINLRLDLFDQEVMPVVEFFEKNSRLIKINGEQSIEKVFEEIVSKI